MWKFLFNKPKDTVPDREIPVLSLSKEQLLSAPDRSLFRLGHSTILLKLQNEFWLTDPVFRACLTFSMDWSKTFSPTTD